MYTLGLALYIGWFSAKDLQTLHLVALRLASAQYSARSSIKACYALYTVLKPSSKLTLLHMYM